MPTMDAAKNWRLLAALLGLSVLISVPSLLRLPSTLPLLSAEVRAAAPQAIEELRAKGLWVVNTDLTGITREQNVVCFHWEHRYTKRGYTGPSESITTCIDA